MILFGDFLEQLTGTRLDQLFALEVAGPLGLADSFYRHGHDPLPGATRPEASFASTEACAWRQRVVRGQVHDENAYALDGVAGHAGLFSTVDDLARWAAELVSAYHGHSSYLDAETVGSFLQARPVVPGSDRVLGWAHPTEGGSGGSRMPPSAVGHTGFTGTSVWLDLERQRFLLLLGNRVHPSRDNDRFLQFRPRLHDLVLAALDGAETPA